MQAHSTNSLFHSFLRDSEEFIKALNRSLMALEQNPNDRAQIDALFRNAPSLKSEADYLKKAEIAAEAHRLENAIQQIRDNSEVPGRGQFDSFFSSVDKLQEMLEQLRQYQSSRTESTAASEKTNDSGGLLHRGAG